ncbi:MAG: hypothetical protein EOP06_10970, partial [Proteobacteria bacterium]
MYNDSPIKDYITPGDEDSLRLALERIEDKILTIMDWVESNHERSDESIVFLNLLSSTSQYVNVFHTAIGNHISILALAIRNLYELNLVSRSVMKSKAGLEAWNSEAIADKIQVLEG